MADKTIEQEFEDQEALRRATIPLRADVLETALSLTTGDRNADYGDPVENHAHIARVFNAITGRDLSARDVALVHVATKLARLAKNHRHHDSHVDGAAYIGIVRECAEAEAVTSG